MPKHKKVILKFELTIAQESTIRSYLNKVIISKKGVVVGGINQKREDVRIALPNLKVAVTTKETERLPSRNFEAEVIDISSGGMCLGVDDEVKLVKNSLATVNLDFIENGLVVVGVILGLARQD